MAHHPLPRIRRLDMNNTILETKTQLRAQLGWQAQLGMEPVAPRPSSRLRSHVGSEHVEAIVNDVTPRFQPKTPSLLEFSRRADNHYLCTWTTCGAEGNSKSRKQRCVRTGVLRSFFQRSVLPGRAGGHNTEQGRRFSENISRSREPSENIVSCSTFLSSFEGKRALEKTVAQPLCEFNGLC